MLLREYVLNVLTTRKKYDKMEMLANIMVVILQYHLKFTQPYMSDISIKLGGGEKILEDTQTFALSPCLPPTRLHDRNCSLTTNPKDRRPSTGLGRCAVFSLKPTAHHSTANSFIPSSTPSTAPANSLFL